MINFNGNNAVIRNIKIERRYKIMRIVVKVGTSTLTHKTGNLNIHRVEQLCKVMSDIKNAGNEMILVTSGAMGMGIGKIGLRSRPDDIATKQAVAAIGQCELMYTYDKLFSDYNHCVAQVLVTKADIDDDVHRKNLYNTLSRLLELNTIPIINENDSVATEEFYIGENDSLAAFVSASIHADLVILLSDIDGLFTSDPHKDKNARLISEVREITPEIIAIAGGAGSNFGTGGMITKIHAAQITMQAGCDMVIANGLNPEILYDIVEGKNVGTKFIAGGKK